MEILFDSHSEGKRIYKVRSEENDQLFMGTHGQCQRFIEVYKEKVMKSQGKRTVSTLSKNFANLKNSIF